MSALKYSVKTLDELPENVRSFYRQDNGQYVLDAEDIVPKAKVDEFRTNNIELQRQLTALKDIDPVKYAELVRLQQEVEEGKLIKEGKVEEVVNLRVTNMKRELEGRLTQTESELTNANAKLAELMIDNAVRQAATKSGVLITALDDVVLRARTVYSMDKGAPVPKDAQGNVIYGKDGTTPMAIDDWIVNLKKNAPHLFAGSQGSGAGGGRGTGQADLSKMTPAQKIAYGLAQGTGMPNLPNS